MTETGDEENQSMDETVEAWAEAHGESWATVLPGVMRTFRRLSSS